MVNEWDELATMAIGTTVQFAGWYRLHGGDISGSRRPRTLVTLMAHSRPVR